MRSLNEKIVFFSGEVTLNMPSSRGPEDLRGKKVVGIFI